MPVVVSPEPLIICLRFQQNSHVAVHEYLKPKHQERRAAGYGKLLMSVRFVQVLCIIRTGAPYASCIGSLKSSLMKIPCGTSNEIIRPMGLLSHATPTCTHADEITLLERPPSVIRTLLHVVPLKVAGSFRPP